MAHITQQGYLCPNPLSRTQHAFLLSSCLTDEELASNHKHSRLNMTHEKALSLVFVKTINKKVNHRTHNYHSLKTIPSRNLELLKD
jgi:hypothetical protein